MLSVSRKKLKCCICGLAFVFEPYRASASQQRGGGILAARAVVRSKLPLWTTVQTRRLEALRVCSAGRVACIIFHVQQHVVRALRNTIRYTRNSGLRNYCCACALRFHLLHSIVLHWVDNRSIAKGVPCADLPAVLVAQCTP